MNKCISEFTFAFLRSLLRPRREAPLRVRSERRRSSRIRSFKEKSPLLPLPLLGEKTISTSGDRYDHLFPTFALGLIKDFFLLSLLFSLFFFSHPKKLPGMIYGKEEFRFLLETRFLPPDPSNLPRCPRPRIIHREILSDFCPLYSTGETKRGEAKRFTIGLLAIARNVETFGKT